MTTLGSMASGRSGAVLRAVSRSSPRSLLELYSSVTRVTWAHTVTLTKIIIGIIVSFYIPVNKQRVRPKTRYKQTLTQRLILFYRQKFSQRTFDSPWQSGSGGYRLQTDGLELLGRILTGGPLQKLYFQRKLQIEKTAIETNYALKPVFLEFFFSITFFFPM